MSRMRRRERASSLGVASGRKEPWITESNNFLQGTSAGAPWHWPALPPGHRQRPARQCEWRHCDSEQQPQQFGSGFDLGLDKNFQQTNEISPEKKFVCDVCRHWVGGHSRYGTRDVTAHQNRFTNRTASAGKGREYRATTLEPSEARQSGQAANRLLPPVPSHRLCHSNPHNTKHKPANGFATELRRR